MALTSTSSKSLLNEYHRLAADTLLGQRHSHLDQAILSAAENGQFERLQSLMNDPRAAVDARCPLTGDTPLIVAARNGHERAAELLVLLGADVTLQNDMEENVLEVASKKIKKNILNSIHHEGRVMSNAKALLQNAWLGDAVSVKKHTSGNHYLDVNCHNSDGMTPLLLVTKDIRLFESIRLAMETDYNPVGVVQDLIDNHADINHCDPQGRSALHFVATSESVHARKMVSLLMRNGSTVDTLDSDLKSPLHIASGKGHTAIIIALVEEGGADINSKGGERNDTPLMLTARAGHSEAARYLIAKGADVTAVDDNGDSALSVAATTSMVSLLKEAWTEQTQAKTNVTSESERPSTPSQVHISTLTPVRTSTPSQAHTKHPSTSSPVHTDDPFSPSASSESSISRGSDLSPLSPDKGLFFLTDLRLSQSLNGMDDLDCGDRVTFQPLGMNEAEADDELDGDRTPRRFKPATHRAHIRAGFEETLAKRRSAANLHTPTKPPAVEAKSKSSPQNIPLENLAYSSADDDHVTSKRGVSGRGNSRLRSRDVKKLHSEKKIASSKPRPPRLALQLSNDPVLSRSHDSLVGLLKNKGEHRRILPYIRNSHNAPPPQKGHVTPSSNTHRSDKLPSLSNMQAIAMVTVDTDQEKLRVHQFNGDKTSKVQSSNAQQPVKRSKSLFSMSNKQVIPPDMSLDFQAKKRRSLGSLSSMRRSDYTPSSKATLLPNVITPQLGLIAGPSGGLVAGPSGGRVTGPSHFQQRGRGRLQPLKIAKSPMTPVNKISSPTLSVVTEATESSDTTRTRSSQDLLGSKVSLDSKESTLKASSHSDFEADSLENDVAMANKTARSTITQTIAEPSSADPLSPLENTVFPPTPVSVLPQSNLVVNYAVQNATTPLSPIWNRMQYLQTDTETSSNSEYITSYIGRLTPLPRLPVPDSDSKRVGADSGQGESTDEDNPGGSGSSEDSDPLEEAAEEESLRWKRGRILGKGAYGKVWEGLMDSAKLIAVKEVELDYTSIEKARSQYEKIQVEVEILRSLRHKNIVCYLGTSMQEGLVFIFMDYISGGSLQSILKRFGPLDSRTIAHYTKQITRALLYLHTNGIIHRDIKGANIMVTTKGIVKLIDFGCAKRYCQGVDGGTGMHSVRGTPYWMAPEVICGDGYGRKSDIWSLGCTIHEMAVTKPPWADFPPESAMFQIGIGKSIPRLPDHLPELLTQLIHRCLIRDQIDRPGAAELLEDQFLTVYTGKKDSTSSR